MNRCKYWDCGWCYAPDNVETNATQGGCFEPNHCPYLKSQMNDALFSNATLEEWLGPEPPEEPEMTEIEKTKREIETLQTKLKILERQETTSTPCEKAYRDAYGTYPVTGMDASSWHVTTWRAFQKGYEADKKTLDELNQLDWKSVALRFGESLVDIVPCGYYDFTPEEWLNWAQESYEKTAHEWLIMLKKERQRNNGTQKVDSGRKEKLEVTEDMIDDLMKDPPDFLKFSLGPTLYEVIEDWYFYTTVTSVLDLVQRIEKWLPPEQSSAGTQSAETEIAVEAHNELLKTIKSKLRIVK